MNTELRELVIEFLEDMGHSMTRKGATAGKVPIFDIAGDPPKAEELIQFAAEHYPAEWAERLRQFDQRTHRVLT